MLVRLHHPDLICPAVVLIVGLHFFAMPPSYRSRINRTAGALFLLVFVLGLLLFQGDTMIAAEALGAGCILWCAAVAALLAAHRILRSFSSSRLISETNP